MLLTPIVTQANGVISVVIQATFNGAQTDASDKAKIAAFGDPVVNIAGNFVDPNNPSFTFAFPTTELWVGITQQLSSYTARFMEAIPSPVNPNQPTPIQGPLDCVTINPSEAAVAWTNILIMPGSGRIAQSLMQLRSNILVPPISPTQV